MRLAGPLAFAAIALVVSSGAGEPAPGSTPTKVLIVTSTGAEAQPFIDALALTDSVPVAGLSPSHPDVLCNADGVCLLVTGSGKAAAAASVTALVVAEALDLSKAYVVLAGLAGIDPARGTLGSVGWAHHAVDCGIAWELDARSIPPGWSTGYLGLFTTSPDDAPLPSYGTEHYELDGALVDKAMALSSGATLTDSTTASAYRANYASAPGTSAPSVVACDTSSNDTLWHGELLGERVRNWTDQLTHGQGTHCSMQQSDNATLDALDRGAKAGLLDIARVAVVHGASHFDRQYPGQAAYDSLQADTGAEAPALENLRRVVQPLVANIVARWSDWKAGVPQ